MEKETILKEPTPEIVQRVEFILNERRKASLTEPLSPELTRELFDIQLTYDLSDTVFEENGRKGVKDIKGEIRVPALYMDYKELYTFTGMRNIPLIAINDAGKYGLVKVDGTGTPITEFEYDSIESQLYAELFIVQKNGLYGLVDSYGHVIIPCELDYIYDGIPVNKLLLLKDGDKQGIYDCNLDLYCRPVYDRLDDKDGLVYVMKDDRWGFINFSGDFVEEGSTDILDTEYLLKWYSVEEDFFPS